MTCPDLLLAAMLAQTKRILKVKNLVLELTSTNLLHCGERWNGKANESETMNVSNASFLKGLNKHTHSLLNTICFSWNT